MVEGEGFVRVQRCLQARRYQPGLGDLALDFSIQACAKPAAREGNPHAISLSNCRKVSDNPRIKTVEYMVA
jgi:hypothetical protein